MADLPSASITIDDTAGVPAGGVDLLVLIAAVAQNADGTPRMFASTKALLDEYLYSPAIDYAAMHFNETGKPVLFVGLPIITAGTVGRIDNSGVTGGGSISVAAGGSGALEEVDGSITMVDGGTVGTDLLSFDLSLDGGSTSKLIRLGTASSYTIPQLGLVVTFSGVLTAGGVYLFTSTAPLWDQAGMQAAREALAAQQKQSRSWLVVGDCANATVAGYIVTEANAYETANERFTTARAQVRDRLPQARLSSNSVHMTGSPTLTFLEVGATGDTITRSAGSFITDGFAVGMVITVAGSVSNNVTGPIASLTALVITLDTTDLANEGPVSSCTIVGSAGLTFAEVGATGDTITRSAGSWLDDGFRVGDTVTITGTASNNVSGAIAALTATLLTFGTTDLAAEVIGSRSVTCVTGETKADWIASIDTAFHTIDGEKRIDLGAGRGRKVSPITGWNFRRPVQWAASIREYQHDLQIPTWRKADGPLSGWSLVDDDGNTVEFDERIDSGALAARFTCFRSWGNGPSGAFIALSLTRDTEGSLLSRTHNMAVVNLACTTTQFETENAIGEVLVLKDDGTGTEASLKLIDERVNTGLAIKLLQGRPEGKRASAAAWRASRTDVLNVPAAELTGTLSILLNGTLEKITTRTRVQTAG